MTLHFSLAFEEIVKSPGSRLLRLVYNVKDHSVTGKSGTKTFTSRLLPYQIFRFANRPMRHVQLFTAECCTNTIRSLRPSLSFTSLRLARRLSPLFMLRTPNRSTI